MSKKKPSGWTQIRHQLNGCSKPDLIALIKDLCETYSDNLDFIQARLQVEDGSGEALEKYRRKIVEQFFPLHGFGKLKLGEARKTIRDYRKASGNLEGTIDLMLTYVEKGTEFTRQFGDINEPFYNSLESVFDDMAQLLLHEGMDFYPRFQERIQHLTTHAKFIGWGYGDFLDEQVDILEQKLAGE